TISAVPFALRGRYAVTLGLVTPVSARSGCRGSLLRSMIVSAMVTFADPGAVPGHSSSSCCSTSGIVGAGSATGSTAAGGIPQAPAAATGPRTVAMIEAKPRQRLCGVVGIVVLVPDPRTSATLASCMQTDRVRRWRDRQRYVPSNPFDGGQRAH